MAEEPKIVYVDMDDTLCMFRKRWHMIKETNPEIEYPQSMIGFFKELEPMEYALACMAMLIDSDRYEVWIATAPSVKNKHCYTEKAEWMETYFGHDILERMIIVPDKSKLIGDYLIDDMSEGKGQDKFQGELIQIGSERFRTWVDITDYLLNQS